MTDFTDDELEKCLRVLRVVARAPERADELTELKTLVAKIYTKARRERRRDARAALAGELGELRESTVLYQKNKALDAGAPLLVAPRDEGYRTSPKPANCYICKTPYTAVHFFYHLLCPSCAEFNYAKRFQRTDLRGRRALVTGGRMKIGYELALRMLRDGAEVFVTTRFPRNAAAKFAKENDFGEFQDRLRIYGLDLRNLRAVEEFADNLRAELDYLDILVHNAAQTVKRPAGFYAHLIEREKSAPELLPPALEDLVKTKEFALAEQHAQYPQVFAPENLLIAQAEFDGHGQPKDFRAVNSWTARLEDVSTLELVETQLVNAVAPFVLTGKLKPLLERSPHERKFVVNVSAMEGQFARRNKTCFHPHTNMAKAALNMLTRTSAQDFARSGIYMNSVDTGWITEENPYPKKTRIQERGFITPLDEIDGAARVYDPVARGLNEEETPVFGCFLKDYAPSEW
ncbi:MAG: SDR family oxidoreductase [Acidobacteria bacterium]|nr:SDR family oxidoreductase [Acidobacteriota bacterium]